MSLSPDGPEARVALVTGSTSGIGAAIARRLAGAGMIVALHSRSSAETGRALAEELGTASYSQADLAEEAETRRLVHEVLDRHGRLDILVNNAAISGVIPHADLRRADPAVWRRLYEVNVIAPWLLVTEAEAALRRSAEAGRPGCILNISSHAGVRPKGSSIPYASSKAALNHMTRLLALALAPDIRVNAIAPGLVYTPMTADWPEAHELWRTRAPMRRGARPEEIAEVAAMVIASDYLTGEVILADGGLNLT
jgi:NAD(P)-dependent dehydrogenase (short-subunit alcohol dehydrogenase family)